MRHRADSCFDMDRRLRMVTCSSLRCRTRSVVGRGGRTWVLMERGYKISATSPKSWNSAAGRLLGYCGAHENARSCSFFSITCPSLYGRSLSDLIKKELTRAGHCSTFSTGLNSGKTCSYKFVFCEDCGPQMMRRDFLELSEVVLGFGIFLRKSWV